jgi:hypothetical protein
MSFSKSPRTIEIGERRTYDGEQPIYGPIPDATGKLGVPCRPLFAKNTVVVLLGQSNAANFCGGKYTAQHAVTNFSLYDGKCYRAADPLVGASGDGGNFATRLGDVLISRRIAKRVVLAPIAMGNTRIEDWVPGGTFHRRILVLIRRLDEAKLTPDFILWQQGEGNKADDDPGGSRYRSHLTSVVRTFRDYGVTAPFLIALCTLCGDPHTNAENVRAGQLSSVTRVLNTFLGPDTDQIGYEDRFDGCHMSETGAQRQAEMWADAIAKVRTEKAALL